MEISCNVIRDLLPLYAEDMVSEDSKRIVDRHLEGCPDCRNSLTGMCDPVEIPKENGESLRNAVEGIVKTAIVSGMTAIMVIVTLIGVVFGVMVHPYPGSMDEVLLSVSEQDGQVVEELTLAGTTGANFHFRKDPETGETVKFISNYKSLYSILFGTVPISDQTYINDYPVDIYQSIWYYDEGELIHLWGDEKEPDIRLEEGSPWLIWALGFGLLFGLLAGFIRKQKLGTVALFMVNIAVADMITTGGNWFPFMREVGDQLFIKLWIVLLAFMLTFSITVCSYLWRNRKKLI